MDGCEAWTVTDAEQRNGDVPDWAEIVLSIERNGKQLLHYFRRHDGELVIEVLHEVLHPSAKRSIRSQLWEQLDTRIDSLKSDEPADPITEQQVRGEARGLAIAIAYMTNPYAPSVDAVRSEAQERWKTRT